MKTKILTTLAAICVAGLLVPAIAQTSNDAPQAGIPAATPDQVAPPGAPDQTTAGQDASPPPVAPADAAAVLAAMAAAASDAAAATGDAAAPAPNGATPPRVITPRGVPPGGGFNGGFNGGGGRRSFSQNAGAVEAVSSPYTPPEQPVGVNTNGIYMNFPTAAPLRQVLSYLADAADLIVVLQVPYISGTVSIQGKNLTKQECVDLLNQQLNKNDYAAVFTPPRTLTVMTKQDAKTSDIKVITDNDPSHVPSNAEMVTQIIPIKFVDAGQLVSDLSVFVSSQATIEANTAGNSIIITDTQANIHHLMEIIKAIDDSAEIGDDRSYIFHETCQPGGSGERAGHHFPQQQRRAGAGQCVRGGRGGGRAAVAAAAGPIPSRRLFGGGGGGGDTTSDRIRRAQQVSAVADQRIQAVVVTAPKSLMDQISQLIDGLDVASPRDTASLYLFGDQCRSEPGGCGAAKHVFGHGIAAKRAKQRVAATAAIHHATNGLDFHQFRT